jgi:hypothetical protein
MNWLTATVAMRPLDIAFGSTAPESSHDPAAEMSPLALQSRGMGMTMSTSSLSVGELAGGVSRQ